MALTKTGDREIVYLTGTPASPTDWEKHEFGFNSNGMKIHAAGAVEFSFDGKEIHGVLAANDKENFVDFHKSKIWVRGSAAVKIWAWL